jgi:hypothetical protein
MSDNPPDGEKPLPPAVNLDPFLNPRQEFGGLSIIEALKALAQGQQEIAAKLSVQPLPNQKESVLDKILKIAEPVAGVFAKVTSAGGGEMEKRALDMFFQLGEGVMQTQILTNRAMQRRLGLDVLKEVPHAVVTG